MRFQKHIGIDYSGLKSSTSRMHSLQVYMAALGQEPSRVAPPSAPASEYRNWNREEVAEWVIQQVNTDEPRLIGIFHAFSFPLAYCDCFQLADWDSFLRDFHKHWPVDDGVSHVEDLRPASMKRYSAAKYKPARSLRLTEKWTSSAKSVFHFDVLGQLAKSTHAGLPWLLRIRQSVGGKAHFWPFDGWSIPNNRTVIAEVFPFIFRNRYSKDKRTDDQQDAFAIARWLSEADAHGFLPRYFDPPLTDAERQVAAKEGWILGVT